MNRIKKALGANQGRAGRAGAALNQFGQTQYTTEHPALSSLLDLAEYTYQNQISRANRFQRLADAHRRRAWKAWDALKEYQRLLGQEVGHNGH